MIEAEYKARLSDVGSVRRRLARLATPDVVRYHDVYFDQPDESLSKSDRELRLRTIVGARGSKHLLTFKDATVDPETGSKPEHETVIENRDAAESIIVRLGYRPTIAFTKDCENYTFTMAGRTMVATVVTVPEIAGVFLELETQVSGQDELPQALADLRVVLANLGVGEDQLTTELYTSAVADSRRQR
ncbi:class IV adenylate cyclase [Nocardia otitidiscaviarum]|uniref:class IV adenylate cyclase n=1 Tax=Nocardia otitidiscaviarum TaxID=1823 RepID=UPI0004A701D3|nr:class IV adenylate cyclase [Nocardia otitidiscaviarum]MBF6134123.1 class IV adenylate cyclase [Nocardia otitidiscaviarum]MBF6484215.1 class IV adenylate cyclase [Nocardia otitidiscaviarum]